MTPLRFLFAGLFVLGLAVAHFLTTHRADVRKHAAAHCTT